LAWQPDQVRTGHPAVLFLLARLIVEVANYGELTSGARLAVRTHLAGIRPELGSEKNECRLDWEQTLDETANLGINGQTTFAAGDLPDMHRRLRRLRTSLTPSHGPVGTDTQPRRDLRGGDDRTENLEPCLLTNTHPHHEPNLTSRMRG
jgi:hypothetical protein